VRFWPFVFYYAFCSQAHTVQMDSKQTGKMHNPADLDSNNAIYITIQKSGGEIKFFDTFIWIFLNDTVSSTSKWKILSIRLVHFKCSNTLFLTVQGEQIHRCSHVGYAYKIQVNTLNADQHEVSKEHQSTCDNFWYAESGRRRSGCKLWQPQKPMN